MKIKLTLLLCLCFFTSKSQWQWANVNAGGSISDRNIVSTKDNSGNIYLTGEFEGIKTFGTYTLTATGTTDVYVAKFDGSGSCLWAIKGGGTLSVNKGAGIAVDNNGYIYITGTFSGEINFGGNNLTQVNTSNNSFIAKFDPSGNCMFLNPIYSNIASVASGLSIDGSGDLVLVGAYVDSIYLGSFTLTSVNIAADIFIAKFNTSGNFIWAKTAGGPSDDSGFGICADAAGNIFITGVFKQTSNFGGQSVSSYGDYDIFVARYDANGNNIWVQKAGSSTGDQGYAISTDNAGNAYVTGYYYPTPQGMSTLPAHFGSFSLSDNGAGNMFIAKYDSVGTCVWAVKGGGSQHDEGLAISTDASGNSYVTGLYHSTSTSTGPAAFGSFYLYSSGGSDAFIVKYNKFGSAVFAQKIGGGAIDKGKTILSYPNGDCLVAGNFADTLTINTIPPTPLSASPQWRVFLAKYAGGSVGIPDVTDASAFQIYPNPANQDLIIAFPDRKQFSPRKLEIITALGKVVREYSETSIAAWDELKINTSDLMPGNYLLRIMDSSTVIIKKFVIVR